MKQFEVFRKGNAPGQSFNKYAPAVAELVERLPQGDAYQYKRRGADRWITKASKPALKEALLDKTLAVGQSFYARRKGGTAVFTLRAIDVVKVPECPDPQATPAVKALWRSVYLATLDAEARFGNNYDLVFMGIYNCRKIDGSSTWSQHAWRNALDFRLRKANDASSSIDATATSFVVNKVEDQAAESLWLVPGHYYHAHLTGDPKCFGTPGCA